MNIIEWAGVRELFVDGADMLLSGLNAFHADDKDESAQEDMLDCELRALEVLLSRRVVSVRPFIRQLNGGVMRGCCVGFVSLGKWKTAQGN